MDLGSIIGLIAGVVFIVLSISFAGGSPLDFVDPASIMITIGGTVASAMIGNPLAKTLNALKTMKMIMKPSNLEPTTVIEKIISLANVARKEGILALEESASDMDDEFLKKGVMLIVDGTDPELVRNILETELVYIDTRHKDVIGVWEFIATIGPAWGMIGTLVGLIVMLGSLQNPETLGPKMAVALVTTFYGSVIANFLATPTANKLKGISEEEVLMREIMIEGMLSIQAGENPRIIEEKLKSFLSPALRSNLDDQRSEAGGE